MQRCDRLSWILHKVTFLLLQAPPSLPERFSAVGPEQPLIVLPGEDVLLPCHLSPQISAENMPVRWFKGQYDDSVHVHRDGQDWNEEQMADYKGRTELIKDGIRVGNVSLIIHNVSSSDSGQYSCFLDAGDFYEKAVMELKVAALGSSPHVYLEDSADGGVQLVCRSSGWYPPPEVWWTDYQGKNLTSFSEVKPGDGSLLFNIKTTITANGNSSTFSCFIKNPTLTEWKQSTTHISDNFLQDLSNCSTERLLIMAACFLSLGTFLVPLLLFVRRKQGIAQCNKRLGELSKDLNYLYM